MEHDFREALLAIAAVLEEGNDPKVAHVRSALAGSPADLESFLRSNELWGGPGSIADCGVVDNDNLRAKLECCLISLGREILATGRVNERTQMWMLAFELWSRPKN